MAKTKQKIVNMSVKFKIPFYSYGNNELDGRAIKSIKKEIRFLIKRNFNFISIFAEEDSDGSLIEDCSRQIKTSIK